LRVARDHPDVALGQRCDSSAILGGVPPGELDPWHDVLARLGRNHHGLLHLDRRQAVLGQHGLVVGGLAVLLEAVDFGQLELGNLVLRDSEGLDHELARDLLADLERLGLAVPRLGQLQVLGRQPPAARGFIGPGLHVEHECFGLGAH